MRGGEAAVAFLRTPAPAAMVEAFCATWKLADSHNFDEYMKALGRCDREIRNREYAPQ